MRKQGKYLNWKNAIFICIHLLWCKSSKFTQIKHLRANYIFKGVTEFSVWSDGTPVADI